MRAVKRKSPAPETDATGAYYETHAADYAEATRGIDMAELYDQFLPHIPARGRILDAGSGAGRDTLAFLKKGYQVEAFDASPRLAEISSRLTGLKTKVLRFQDFVSEPRFDGIWACASLVHVPRRELADSVRRLVDALKPGGALFVSLKKGAGERVARDGRLFTDLDEATARALLAPLGFEIARMWVSEGQGVRRGRGDWLNIVAVKKP